MQPLDDVLDSLFDNLGGSFGEVEYRGAFGHPQHMPNTSGVRVYFGNPRPEQPIVINGDGSACELVADELLIAMQQLDGWLTRIDVALDLPPSDQARRRLMQMRREWRRGKVRTMIEPTSHQSHQDDGPDQGWTEVFGGKQSGHMLRVYDRRGPLRLEHQFRPVREVGAALPEMLQKLGAPGLWRRLARNLNFPMPWYQELLNGETCEWDSIRPDETDLQAAIDAVRRQLGVTLFGLGLAGITLEDLSVEPEKPRGEILCKFNRWSKQAENLGLDGTKLKEFVKCKSKSRRVRI